MRGARTLLCGATGVALLACGGKLKRRARDPTPIATTKRFAARKLSPEVADAWAQLTGSGVAQPFRTEKETVYYERCQPFMAVVLDVARQLRREAVQGPKPSGTRAGKDGTRGAGGGRKRGASLMSQAIAKAVQSGLSLSADDVHMCANHLEEEARAYIAASTLVELKLAMRNLAITMANRFGRSGKLCPSTATPVPAKLSDVLAERPYSAKAEDYAGPGWKCLGIRFPGPQRFQYEIVSDPDGRRFEIIGRGAPAKDGKVYEYRLEADIAHGEVLLDEIKGRYLERVVPQRPSVPPRPVGLKGWRVGTPTPITLVVSAMQEHDACAYGAAVDNLRCAHATKGASVDGEAKTTDPQTLLRPYEIVPNPEPGLPRYVLAAGLWSQPQMVALAQAMRADGRPRVVQCTFLPKGGAPDASIRHGKLGRWRGGIHPFAGTLSGCEEIAPPAPQRSKPRVRVPPKTGAPSPKGPPARTP